jgi:membrane-bound serine protease (ClpP class)
MDPGSGQTETRLLTEDALRTLQSGDATIQEPEILKDRGAELILTGEEAFAKGLLVKATAKDRAGLMKLFRLNPQSMQKSTTALADGVAVVMIDLNTEFSPTLADYATREMQKALSRGARYIVFRINGTGGDTESAQGLAISISQLSGEKANTIAWVPRNARGNAAIVALACDRILLGDEAGIGDIESALTLGVDQIPEEQGASIRRLEAFMGDLAKQKGRSPALMRAMVNSEVKAFSAVHKTTGETAWMTEEELIAVQDQWVTSDVVPETNMDEPLFLSPERAIALSIAESKCRDEGELRLKLGLTARTPISVVSNTWVDGLVFFLNSGIGAFLLISAGIIALYFEAHFPSGFFTIISITCFSLFFWSRFLGGTAGTLELVLFVLGVALLALEFFVIPGFGICGISGVLLMCVSLVMASYTFSGMTAGESFETSLRGLGTLSAALVTVIVVAVVMNQFLPQIPFIKNLILTPPGYAAPEARPVILNPNFLRSSTQNGPVAPGEIGVAASVLRPSGKAAFGDKFLDVVSDGGFIEHGARIEVLRVAGNRIVVRPLEQ